MYCIGCQIYYVHVWILLTTFTALNDNCCNCCYFMVTKTLINNLRSDVFQTSGKYIVSHVAAKVINDYKSRKSGIQLKFRIQRFMNSENSVKYRIWLLPHLVLLLVYSLLCFSCWVHWPTGATCSCDWYSWQFDINTFSVSLFSVVQITSVIHQSGRTLSNQIKVSFFCCCYLEHCVFKLKLLFYQFLQVADCWYTGLLSHLTHLLLLTGVQGCNRWKKNWNYGCL